MGPKAGWKAPEVWAHSPPAGWPCLPDTGDHWLAATTSQPRAHPPRPFKVCPGILSPIRSSPVLSHLGKGRGLPPASLGPPGPPHSQRVLVNLLTLQQGPIPPRFQTLPCSQLTE